MEKNKRAIIDRVKSLRGDYNLTQKELAIKLRVGQSAVATVERTGNISDQFVYILSKEFGVREEWIKTGTGEMKKSPEEILRESIDKLSPEEAQEAIKEIMYKNKVSEESGVYSFANEKEKPEFYKVMDFLKDKFNESDRDMQGYLTVKIKKDFPEYEEHIKKIQFEQKNA